jgi:hypothetical protein
MLFLFHKDHSWEVIMQPKNFVVAKNAARTGDVLVQDEY